jgi:hypothetical protein
MFLARVAMNAYSEMIKWLLWALYSIGDWEGSIKLNEGHKDKKK